jgi:hypothetical protein
LSVFLLPFDKQVSRHGFDVLDTLVNRSHSRCRGRRDWIEAGGNASPVRLPRTRSFL